MASPAESMDENEVTLFFGDDISDGDIAIESPTIEATIPEDEDLFVKNADTEEFSDIFSGTGAGIDDFDIVAGEPPHASEAENDNDIACMIPGLYRMLYLRKDNGVNGLGERIRFKNSWHVHVLLCCSC
ncbi:hypothetical protein BC936DRAFT_138478 [Jimgerdemannia flammicorona]|uniref:Uncharacterized protein n=1 Tax=Jimgerdemannia flammicorona TaxID=994334 RepID=A0A433CC89_9FUNG|nr:hypothetical protein BC936DRAFT_138478 [Jimgerdemannia flammicorona]